MGAPYRNEADALLARCESLRRQLESAQQDAQKTKQLKEQLEVELAKLERARLTAAERAAAATGLGRRRLMLGLLIGALLCAIVAAIPVFAPGDGEGSDRMSWWDHAKPHCNSVEVDTYVRGNPAPDTPAGRGQLATCYALANKIDRARDVLEALPQPRAAVQRLFQIVHPIADAGDDVAAGPVMELVVEYTPENFMAQFHAGIAAYENGHYAKARGYLTTFLGQYKSEDGWRARAKQALADMDGMH